MNFKNKWLIFFSNICFNVLLWQDAAPRPLSQTTSMRIDRCEEGSALSPGLPQQLPFDKRHLCRGKNTRPVGQTRVYIFHPTHLVLAPFDRAVCDNCSPRKVSQELTNRMHIDRYVWLSFSTLSANIFELFNDFCSSIFIFNSLSARR